MIVKRWISAALLGWLLINACAAAVHSAPSPILRLTLTAHLDPVARRIDALDVTMSMPAPQLAGAASLLQMPLVIYNVETAAASVADLSASDARGPLPLEVRDDTAGKEVLLRHWFTTRPATGQLIVHYRVPMSELLAPLGAAPPIELRATGAAFSAGGVTFLALPETQADYRIELRWDLSGLPVGSVGLSSLGAGDIAAKRTLSMSDLGRQFFMAGQIGAWPDGPSAVGFFAAWQGQPPFDARVLMQWTGQLYEHYIVFFKEDSRAPYGVFLRPNPVNPGGGIGQDHSFVATFDEHTPVKDLKFTLAHEMLHTFIGGLGGDERLEDAWFSEGLAVFYQRILPARFGEITSDDFLEDLNKTAARYYTNRLANTPNSQLSERFWSDTLIRVLPYDRGALYFATVNDAVRKASKGMRSLDNLILTMLQRRARNGEIVRHDWEEVISQELGKPGLDEFRAMLAGMQVLPASDAFGECFRRTTRPLRRYELGFDPTVMAERKRIVRGLVADSAAARAGLRDGDEIMKPFGQDSVQEDQKATLTLHVRRGDADRAITYLPRADTVDAFQWERAPGHSTSSCRY